MEWMIVMLILLLALCFIWNVCSKNTNNKENSCFCTIIISVGLTVVYTNYKSKDKPTALDVYQGKTTLKYEVIDGVKVDSVVVWKEEFKLGAK